MASSLLIEPFGIETRFLNELLTGAQWLLIEPFGIETGEAGDPRFRARAFNRTVWN